MEWNYEGFQDRVASAVDAYDGAEVGRAIDDLIDHLRTTDERYPDGPARRILQLLRRKRFFADLERAGDALIRSGQDSARVRRLYAQSLLDQSKLTTGIIVLEALEADTSDDPNEHGEACGLLGRAYKQAYIDAQGSTQRSHEDLRQAIQWYYDVYRDDDAQLWHGINAVALLARAGRAGIDVAGYPEARTMAAAVLTAVKDKRADEEADAWDYATAAEACVALGEHDEALVWMRRYVDGSDADAFELASTLRQMEEVWQLDAARDPGRRLLPYLRAELLQREGARVDLDAGTGDLAAMGDVVADQNGQYEAVLGTEAFNNVKWFHDAMMRASAVARVESLVEDEPKGTAFVVRPSDFGLTATVDGEMFLMTNSHVISESGDLPSIEPGDARINFELDPLVDSLTVAAVEAESPVAELDYTIVRTEPPLVDRPPIDLAPAIPLLQQRVYIIGHPAGGKLKFSIYDNRLLNHDPPFLHYRAPTRGGSSGSPVMNKNWQLIGLHHVGDKEVTIPDEPGMHAANEGIAITEITPPKGT